MTRIKARLLLAGCLLCLTSHAVANEKKVADEFFDGHSLKFIYKENFNNATISVSGPNGFNISTFQKRGEPSINLSRAATGIKTSAADAPIQDLPNASSLADGVYNYQITVATDKLVTVTDKLNNGRGKSAKTTMNASETQSGHFRVKDGVIVTDLEIKEGE